MCREAGVHFSSYFLFLFQWKRSGETKLLSWSSHPTPHPLCVLFSLVTFQALLSTVYNSLSLGVVLIPDSRDKARRITT